MEKIHIKFDLSAIKNYAVELCFTRMNYFWIAYAILFGKNIGLLIVVAICGTLIHELGHALVYSVWGYESWIGFYEAGDGAFTVLKEEVSEKYNKQASRSLKYIIYISGPAAEWFFLILFWQYSGNFVIPALWITNELWISRRQPNADFHKIYLMLQGA